MCLLMLSWGGVPAQVIKYRFNQDIIDRIERGKWYNRDVNWLEKNIDSFHLEISGLSDLDFWMNDCAKVFKQIKLQS